MILQKIISGGQTGVDRGALDACLNLKFGCGGWCPAGRRAEDGPIPARYPLQENHSPYYDDRTRQNIESADATLILYNHKLTGGSLLTYSIAKSNHHPVFLFQVSPFFIENTLEDLFRFLETHQVRVLNVAGPRASQWDKAYESGVLITSRLIQKVQQR